MKNKKYCDDYRMGVSPLHHEMARGSTETVVALLKHGHHNVNSRDSAGQTPLYYAIFRGYRFGVNLLLEKGAGVNIKDNDQNTPLHFAVKKGNANIVTDLLINGGDLEQTNNYGQTVLQYAIVWNYSKTFEPMIDLLLKNGAKVNSKDMDMETPLHSAAARKDSKFVCLLLLERGANVCARDNRGNTPLHIASMKQSIQAMVALIDIGGADLDERNKLGETPLHIAIKSRVPESLKFLLGRKAKIDAKNYKDKTALHLASELGLDDLMKMLIDHGANMEDKDYQGNTALHLAAKSCGGDRTVDILLESGASVDVRNNDGESPLLTAFTSVCWRYSSKVILKLMDWGTSVNFQNNFQYPFLMYTDQYQLIMRHRIKLICAKIHLSISDYELPSIMDFQSQVEITLKELDEVKANRFGRHSLYDILLSYSDPTFLTNDSLKEAINLPEFESQYPIYGPLIKITFKKAEKRFELLNQAQESLKIPLPNEIQRKILAFLDDNSLLSVISAFQS